MKANKIIEPTVCPFCGSPVIRLLEDGAHIYCSNPNCSERKVAKLNYFVTKECMNIDGLSEKTLRKLRNTLKIDNWYDLYSYTFDDFVAAGLGEKTALKICTELENSKTKAPAENVLMALGIPSIGKVNAKKLLDAFGSIEEIERTAKTTQVDLTKIISHRNGYEIINLIGEVAGQNVVDYMNNNSEELQYVYKYFNTKSSKKESATSNKLTGLTILATGTLNNFSRDGIKQSVIENGGTYASGISKKLDYLIVGAAAGSSKLKKAEEFGIKQISEDDYINLIS